MDDQERIQNPMESCMWPGHLGRIALASKALSDAIKRDDSDLIKLAAMGYQQAIRAGSSEYGPM